MDTNNSNNITVEECKAKIELEEIFYIVIVILGNTSFSAKCFEYSNSK